MRLRLLLPALLMGAAMLVPAEGKTRLPKPRNVAVRRAKPSKARKFKPAKFKAPKGKQSKPRKMHRR